MTNRDTLDLLDAAAALVHSVMPPTPQYCWPLLSRRVGAELWVKHENHTPIGAFKLRGGLVYLDHVRRTEPQIQGIVTATRGNHGQSIAFAASRLGLAATIVVPHGNSVEKNRAMAAFGAHLVEEGHDFQAAYEYAAALAEREGLHLVRTFHPMLVRGVASYGLELFRAVPDLDVVYVPIGQGSGISGVIAARQARGLTTEIVRGRRRRSAGLCHVLRRRHAGQHQFGRHDRRRPRRSRPRSGGARGDPPRRRPNRDRVRGRDPPGDAGGVR
jgi:threonine dehydratase